MHQLEDDASLSSSVASEEPQLDEPTSESPYIQYDRAAVKTSAVDMRLDRPQHQHRYSQPQYQSVGSADIIQNRFSAARLGATPASPKVHRASRIAEDSATGASSYIERR